MKLHPLLKNKDQLDIIHQILDDKVIYFDPQAPEIQEKTIEAGYEIGERLGFSSEDINVYYRPNFKEFINGNLTMYKEMFELFMDSLKSKNSLLKKIKASFFSLGAISLELEWAHWFWVVDSLDSISFDIAQKKIKKENLTDFEKIVQSITREEKLNYVNEHYVQVNDYMWVSETDPTCLIYDNEHKPYALKNGWSKDQIGEILVEWFFEMTNVRVQHVVRTH